MENSKKVGLKTNLNPIMKCLFKTVMAFHHWHIALDRVIKPFVQLDVFLLYPSLDYFFVAFYITTLAAYVMRVYVKWTDCSKLIYNLIFDVPRSLQHHMISMRPSPWPRHSHCIKKRRIWVVLLIYERKRIEKKYVKIVVSSKQKFLCQCAKLCSIEIDWQIYKTEKGKSRKIE